MSSKHISEDGIIMAQVHYWAKALAGMVETQMELSAMVDGERLSIHKENPAIYFAAMMTEAGELLNHFNWKPWKQERPVEVEDMAEEWADVLAFFLVLTAFVMEATGLRAEELMDYHRFKTAVNMDRFTGKVPGYGIKP